MISWCIDWIVYNYFIWPMIQRGSDTSFTNLWSLLLYIQSLLHYIENAQDNKKNTILSYNIAENNKRVKLNTAKRKKINKKQKPITEFIYQFTGVLSWDFCNILKKCIERDRRNWSNW
jgi:hypothetical protein